MTPRRSFGCALSCALVAASCSLIGDPDFEIAADAGDEGIAAVSDGEDASGTSPPPGTAAVDAGLRAAADCRPPDEPCTTNGECCGFEAFESLCVQTALGTRCLAVCSDSRACSPEHACVAAQGGASVCLRF